MKLRFEGDPEEATSFRDAIDEGNGHLYWPVIARILKAAGQKAPNAKPILEINPQHPAVLRLKYEESRFDDWAALLFEQAMLAEGGQLDDPAGFVRRINDLMMALSGK